MNKLRAAVPLLVTLAGFVGIGGLWLRRIVALGPSVGGVLAGAALVVYGAWLAWESRISVREIDKTGFDHDRGTMELAAAAKIGLLLGCLVPDASPSLGVGALGIALMIGGATFRGAAIRALGAQYSHRIRVPAAVVERGPYAVVRHPAYMGTLVAHAGLAVVFSNRWSFAALLVLWVPAVALRTALEDRLLRRMPVYQAYASRVPSLVPSPLGREMKTFQSRLPVLLSVSFVVAILALLAARWGEWTGAVRFEALAMVGAYLAWLAVESRVAVKEIGKGTTSHDHGTLELYAFGRAFTLLAALGLGRPDAARGVAGLVLFAAAVAFRIYAIKELGAFYSHRVRVAGNHSIVDMGPYRILRHPAYTGMLLAHAGVVTVFFHPVALVALLGVLLPAIVLRVRVEERVLMTIDGYAEYSAGRPRLLPSVW